MVFYLAGQTSFGNRGCEALVRGTIDILRATEGPNVKFLVPSVDAAADIAQWPDHADYGVRFVAAPAMPSSLKWWCSLMQRLPGMAGVQPLLPRYSAAVEADLASADAVLMIGGDIISLDYGIHSLYMWSRLIDRARALGKPTYLWAASVGPFEANGNVVSAMRSHLRGYKGITVRETTSAASLAKDYGLPVKVVGDPAYRLASVQPRAALGVDMERCRGAVGFNVSPLIRKLFSAQGGGRSLEDTVLDFLRWLIDDQGRKICLIYHVDQAEMPANSDLTYLRQLAERLNRPDRCYVLPPGLNACELKGVIAGLDSLVAARTHATVAAFSQAVPTLSIGYSRKARGLNEDLFGSIDYLVETKDLTLASMQQTFGRIQQQRASIIDTLREKARLLREAALGSSNMLRG
ncbi:polysaccharide pyruvyl transferase family protein [Paucibacter sp. M5-1]|uniref:polysaccharide pyruvyl transferase family protein n=1 Tax=Paucibacter sp. M5-1 TaxID=3015998 RepID=UPI0022B92122|nr:polysaccharide pyruvyl transferase family protein [Paucibacter sp. M5-1]MCZ7879471.1 polysaccharide pyruvyl transferase family protein [Paucibacter sp. M5-1]